MTETRLALIHRVIVPDAECPKEYAILVTDRRSIFIRQKKTRSAFVLRGEMRFGTALVTDVEPKTLEDYDHSSLESLVGESGNITIPHDGVVSLTVRNEPPAYRTRDLFVWLTMRMQKEVFQVYDFELAHLTGPDQKGSIRFYAVPLGGYFKPRRQVKTRETILREYAEDILKTFQRILSAEIVSVDVKEPLPWAKSTTPQHFLAGEV